MSKPIDITSAVTFVPSSYSNNSTFTTAINTGNGLNGSGNTSSYASFSARTTSQYGIYTFDVSSIPLSATINSVACAARAKVSSTSNFTTRTIQLYNNNTAKGNATTVNSNTSSVYNLTTGTWTRSELSNINLRITGQRSANQQRRIDFYGASLTINYTYQEIEYDITAYSEVAGATVSPASQTVTQGSNASIVIDTNTLDNLVLEDNGVDVTDQIQYITPTPGTITFTGIPTSFDYANSVYDTSEGNQGVYSDNIIDNGLTDHNSTTRCALYSVKGSGAISYMYYNFNCSSIPSQATITSVTCQFKGGSQGSSYYSSYIAQLCSGTVTKGNSTSVTGSNSSPTTVTINGGNSWTRHELDDIKIKFQVTRGNSNTNTGSTFSFFGATLSVQYTMPSTPYYEYTISNISADHTVVFKENVIIPPEEDPDKTYYPITISSINATTEPKRGTVRVESGTSETIYIYPTDPQLTLAYDNGVDISSQLVSHPGEQATSAITTAPGASYGFVYSSSTGYYVSNNKGNDKTAAVCVVTLNLPVRSLVTFQYINYAEATYDFGVFGEVDIPLSNNYYAAGSGGATITDSTYKLACNTSAYNSSTVRTLTYEIESGEHTIYIKYSKDDATSSNNDTLQFRISAIEELEPNVYYTYNLNNISDTHSLIFIFGDVSYYFINSSISNASTSGCKLYPAGQMVQLPGDNYTLTVVPDNPTDTLRLTDNGIDVTNDVERKEIETVKEGVTSITVNFVYTITNIQTGHTLVALCEKEIISNDLYVKTDNHWVSVKKVFSKNNNSWEEVSDYSELFIQGKIYLRDTST